MRASPPIVLNSSGLLRGHRNVPVTILLNADAYRLRANAGGLLADLADEYPEAIRPAVPRAIELLDDEDDKVRYNATLILARVAKAYPDDVTPAIGALIDALNEEFTYSRSNACWSLGYLKAEEARETLTAVKQSDPNDEGRNGAECALHQINGSDE